jgi:outer membrane cobalamin receptor
MKTLAASLTLLSLSLTFCRAQEPDTTRIRASYEMPPVVVTATRTPRLLSEATGNVSLISSEEIKETRPMAVGEMLKGVETGNLGSYGGYGSLTNFGLRGAYSYQTLILLDGRPAADPQSGDLDLNALAVANVEHIEVVRGGASVLWGPNAMGGVVNLITKSGQGSKVHSRLSAQAGSYGKALRTFEIGGPMWRTFDFYVTGEGKLSKGFRVNDAYDGKNFTGRLGWRCAKDWRLEASGQRHVSDLGVPGSISWPSPQATQKDRRAEGDLRLTGAFVPCAELKVNGFWRQLKYTYDDPGPAFPSANWSRTDVMGGEAQQSLRWHNTHLVTLGVRAQTSKAKGMNIGNHSVDEGGGFLQDEVDLLPFGLLKVTPSVGVHHNSAYGTRVLPGGSLKLWHFYYSWQTSFRAPSLNDLYWDEPYVAKGNPSLKPEEAVSWELGWGMGVLRRFQVKANYFKRGVRNLILWEDPDGDWVFSPYNLGRTRTSGFELSGEMKTGIGLAAKVTWSGVTARDVTNGVDLTLPYQPARSGSGWIEYKREFLHYQRVQAGKERSRITVTLRFSGDDVGSRYADGTNQVSLPKYGTGSFLLTLRVVGLTGYYGMDNFGNVEYQSRYGYPMPGKTYRAGLAVELPD